MGILISRVGLLVFHFKSHINLRLPKCCFSFFFFFLESFSIWVSEVGQTNKLHHSSGNKKSISAGCSLFKFLYVYSFKILIIKKKKIKF